MPDPVLLKTDIHNVIFDAMQNHLITKMQLEYEDDTNPSLIRSGKLQDDPFDYGITILFHPGGEKHPNIWNDKAYSGAIDTFPSRESGGSTIYLRRRYSINIRVSLEQSGDLEARQNITKIAFNAMSRLEDALLSMPFYGLYDDFGESVYERPALIQSFYNRAGGGDDTFIWNGTVIIEFLTVKTTNA